MQDRVQVVAVKLNIDWARAWEVLQKLSPILQEVITTILENTSDYHPVLVSAGPPIPMTVATVSPVAQIAGVDTTSLLEFLKSLSPIVAKIILALLQKKELVDA